MGDQIVLIAGSDEFFDVVREGGIVEVTDVGEVYHLLYQGAFLFGKVSVITNNGCNLLHGNADGFNEIRLLHPESVHDRVLDDHGEKEGGKKRRIDGFCLVPETEQQEGQRQKKGIPAVGAEQAYHNT